jgi:hypothetical protein
VDRAEVSIPNSSPLPIASFAVAKRIREKRNSVRRKFLAIFDEQCRASGAEFRLDTLLSAEPRG